MIFQYDELKKCVEDDFNRFYNWRFDENQIFLAVMDEYKHASDFHCVENICIHIFLALEYEKNNLNNEKIVNEIPILINNSVLIEAKNVLKEDFHKFMEDIATLGISI